MSSQIAFILFLYTSKIVVNNLKSINQSKKPTNTNENKKITDIN